MNRSPTTTRSGLALVCAAAALLLGIGVSACKDSLGLTLPNGPGGGAGVVSGIVTNHSAGAPVGGLTVTAGGRAAITDSAGRYQLTGVPLGGPIPVSINGQNILFRSLSYTMAASRSDVSPDVLVDSLPFSIEFYRFFVRNGFEGALQPTNPWTVDPSFYVRTIVEGTEIRVSPIVIAAMEADFRQSVPALSGGRRRVAAFESGEEIRPPLTGWVNVNFFPSITGAFGQSSVGGDSGVMQLRWFGPPDTNNDLHCASAEVFVADHEITHTMGFYHTPNPLEDSFSGDGCSGTLRSDKVKFHADVMYSRPRGNRDPDIDPLELVHAHAPGAPDRPMVTCTLRLRR
jgi:hypothetical protein